MKGVSIAWALLLLAACAPDAVAPDHVEYQAREHGLALRYPARLHLQERREDFSPMLSLVLVEDLPSHRDFLAGAETVLTEAPPMITVEVFSNPDGLGAADWVAAHTNWILVNKAPETVTIGGLSFLVFFWDGLYAGKSAVLATAQRAYVFSVTWLTERDALLADFSALLDGVRITAP